MLSTRNAETDFHATTKVLAGARGGRAEEFLPDVPFFCTAILVGSWKGPQLALPSGNCSFPQHLWSPILHWQPEGQDQAISLPAPAETICLFCPPPFFLIVVFVGRKTSHSAESILPPSQADCLGLAPGSIRRGKMHFKEYFCIHSSCNPPGGRQQLRLVPSYQQRIPFNAQ